MRTRTIKKIEQAFHEMGLADGVKESKYNMMKVCELSLVKEEEIEIRYDNNSIIEVDNA
jgi:hypothetical protein